MSLQIFISHSFRDAKLLQGLRASLTQQGIKPYVAEADPRYGESLPKKITDAIDKSDAVIVILTREASGSASVNQEIGYAKKADKIIIPMVEDGVNIGVMLQGLEFVEFTVDKIDDAFNKVSNYVTQRLSKKGRNDLVMIVVVAAAVVLGILVLFTIARRKKHRPSGKQNKKAKPE